MADTGLAIAPAPSARAHSTDGPTEESSLDVTINRQGTIVVAPSNPPLQPIHEVNQHASNSDNDKTTVKTSKLDAELTKQHPNALIKPEQASPDSLHPENSKSSTMTAGIGEHGSCPIASEIKEESSDVRKTTSCGDIGVSDRPSELPPNGYGPDAGNKVPETSEGLDIGRKQRDIEEMIIDNFAICAFASWEDLQDEINEKIAPERAEQKDTAIEKNSGNSSQPKKRSRPKKEKSNLKESLKQEGSGTLAWATKPKKKKKLKSDKKFEMDGHKEDLAQTQCSGQESSITTASTTNVRNVATSVNKKPGTGKESSNNESSSRKPSRGSKVQGDPGGKISGQPSDRTFGTPNDIQAIAESKIKSHGDRLSQTPVRELNTSRATPYSPYGSNPHLNRLHDITSQTGQPMQSLYPVNFHNQEQTNSQSQQSNKPNAPTNQQAQSKTVPPHHPYRMPYHDPAPPSMMYPPPPPPTNTQAQPQRQSSSGLNQGSPYHNYYATHNPYIHPAPNNPSAQTYPSHPIANSYGQPPSYASQHMPQALYYGHYQSPQHLAYPHPVPQSSSLSNPFSMYPQHLAQPQHSNSMMSTSMSMSAMPNSYGSPYIVTDTTISRQTSILPPMPTALEQAAASSVANRFGHHPGFTHPMSQRTYAPALATSRGPNPLHQSATERSFMELAKSYSSAHGASAGYPSYISSAHPRSPALPATPAPSSSSTPSNASPYRALDRWPRISSDHSYERPGSRLNGLYNSNPATLSSNRGGYGMMPPPFPNTMMFANTPGP